MILNMSLIISLRFYENQPLFHVHMLQSQFCTLIYDKNIYVRKLLWELKKKSQRIEFSLTLPQNCLKEISTVTCLWYYSWLFGERFSCQHWFLPQRKDRWLFISLWEGLANSIRCSTSTADTLYFCQFKSGVPYKAL